MASSVIDELQAVCNSLGMLDENDGTYMRDRHCKSCLKEVIRLLNADSKQHDVRITLSELNLIKCDLIPIINQYCDFNEGDKELFSLIIRLATNLTSSPLLFFDNQPPTDLESIKIYNKLQRGLYRYKVAFAEDTKIWKTINTHLRHTEDDIIFERLIILMRNILLIPVDSSDDLGMPSGFDSHTHCLYRMQQSGVLHTIIEITQRGSDFCFHITEIVYLMLRDQNPMTVASAQANITKRKLEEDDEDRKLLAELSAREKRRKETRNVPPRFKSSLFVVRGDERDLLSSKIVKDGDSLSFDSGKTQLRKSKNKKPLQSGKNSSVISDKNTKQSQITYSLKVFSKMFVEEVYANYMQHIKHNLIQKKSAENDESYYLWSVQFFSSFCRHMNMSLGLVSETMSTSTLHFIQILINDYLDRIKIEKKRTQIENISKRLHLALRAYREILYFIQTIEEGSEFWDTIEQIKNIFKQSEYNTLVLTLFQQYDESKHCPEYLSDLIKTNDVFLQLFEEHSRSQCVPEVLKAYTEVLRDFKTNDTATNLQILKFFERVAYDCKCEVMLLQVSLLQILLSIVDYSSSLPGYDRFVALTSHLMSAFGEMINKKRWMIQELLFWKKNTDVIDIENAIDPPLPPVVASPLRDIMSDIPDASSDGDGNGDSNGDGNGDGNGDEKGDGDGNGDVDDNDDDDDVDELRAFLDS